MRPLLRFQATQVHTTTRLKCLFTACAGGVLASVVFIGSAQAQPVVESAPQVTLTEPALLPKAVGAPRAPAEVIRALGQPVLQGEQRFRWFAFTVYDIRLWVPMPVQPQTLFNRPFVLELEYARSLKGKAIAERSLKEMQALAAISDAQQSSWLALMEQAFPDVNEGDRLSGVWQPDGTVQFYLNGQQRLSVNDVRFGELFFGIWLSPDTSEPSMRTALLGLNP